jgi:hypothetical protein
MTFKIIKLDKRHKMFHFGYRFAATFEKKSEMPKWSLHEHMFTIRNSILEMEPYDNEEIANARWSLWPCHWPWLCNTGEVKGKFYKSGTRKNPKYWIGIKNEEKALVLALQHGGQISDRDDE